MAGKYDEYEKILYGDNSSQLAKNKKSIANYKTRIAAQGVDPDTSVDNRNWLEKALNLKQDQNFIFDIFEVLNRPQQALFGGIENLQQGGDFLEGAKEGLYGNKDTEFKDILMNTGYFNDREGKLDVVDVLGFGGDVFLDPMNLPVVPGIKAGGKLASIDDALGIATKKVAKGAVSKTDDLVKKGLGYLDRTKGVLDNVGNKVKLDYTNRIADKVSDLAPFVTNKADLVGKGANLPKGRLERYVGLKEDVSNLFKVPEKSKQAILKGREIGADTEQFKKQIGVYLGDQQNKLKNAAPKLAASADPVAQRIGKSPEELDKALMLFAESKAERKTKIGKLLDLARGNSLDANENTIKALESLKEEIPQRYLDKLDLSVTVGKTGKVKLGADWSKENIANVIEGFDGFSPEKLDEVVDIGNFYTDAAKKEIDELNNLYKTNKDFKEIADEIVGDTWNGGTKLSTVDTLNKMIDDANFATNLSGKYDSAKNIGYAPHISKLTLDNIKNFDDIPKGTLKGNAGILSERTLIGSARERNDIWEASISKNYDNLEATKKTFVDNHRKLFEDEYLKAVGNRYFEQLPNTIKQNKIVNDILIDQTFGDEKTLKRVRELQKDMLKTSKAGDKAKLETLNKEYNALTKDLNIKFLTKHDSKIPTNYTVVKGDTLKNMSRKLRTIGGQLGTEDKMASLLDVISKQKGGIAMDNNILRMLQVSTDTKQMNSLTRAYTGWLNKFKKWKTASPSFLMNNLVGNSSNLYLSGINYTEQAALGSKVYDIMQNGEKYSNMLLNGETLTKAQKEIADNWDVANRLGIVGKNASLTALNVQDMPESVVKYFRDGTKPSGAKWISEGIPYFNNLANQKMDSAARLTVMLKAAKDPSYIKNLGIKTTGTEAIRDAVAKVMFDPDMMTDFERNTMKKIVPFYTYAKNNLVYHLDNMGQNLGRYEKTMQGIKDLQKAATGGNEENIDDYIKNSLYIPIPGLGKNGEYTLLRANLPFGQVLELADNPLEEVVNMTTPLIKSPYELAANKSIFNQSEIEKFPGQQGSISLLNRLPGPLGTAKGQYALSSLSGFDVPIKTISRLVDNGDPASTVLMRKNVNTDRLNRTYEQIDDLQNLMKQYEQQGYEFSTLSELRKANKNGVISNIDAIFAKYGVSSNTNTNSNDLYSEYEKILYGK